MGRRVAIIGAGLGGLCAAITARKAGHEIVILEEAGDVGGTWRANRYPGVACDIPALLYQLSFAPHPQWSHFYARGQEIHEYTRSLVDRFDLGGALRLSEGVRRAEWSDELQHWSITTSKGATIVADAIIPALGQLNRPRIPEIEGRERFTGRSWHSAAWPDGEDVSAKRVGVIGAAASAVQLVPEIAKVADHLVLFQRTPNRCVPRGDIAYSEEFKRLLATAPDTAQKIAANRRQQLFDDCDTYSWQALKWTPAGREAFRQMALEQLENQIPDPALRARLTPDYPVGCKRILATDDFYPALLRGNVTLETGAIQAITETGVRTASGHHGLDILVFATGFETTQWNWSMEVVGKGGRTLKDAWKQGPDSYLGIMVSGFPNMFVVYGPNTNLGHNSITVMIEAQCRYALDVLAQLETDKKSFADVTVGAQQAFTAKTQADLDQTVWADPHCDSWYKTENGKIYQNWSGNCADYAAATSLVDRDALNFV
jgi:cation diffusion facilitator CzcD-associated flavoprotein CzcO